MSALLFPVASEDILPALSADLIEADRGAIVLDGCVSLWVATAGPHEHVFSSLEDAQAFREAWDGIHPLDERARIRSAKFAISDLYQPNARRRMISVEMPCEVIDALRERCQYARLNPHRVISAVVLNFLNQPKSGAAVIKFLEAWEAGRRVIKRWHAEWAQCG